MYARADKSVSSSVRVNAYIYMYARALERVPVRRERDVLLSNGLSAGFCTIAAAAAARSAHGWTSGGRESCRRAGGSKC